MNTIKLQRCPFCGGGKLKVMTAQELYGDPERSDYTAVVCDYQQGGCGASTGFHQYIEDAIVAWEKRC